MIVIPAIDILDRQCVRLKEGNFAEKTVYFNDPLLAAKHWKSEGAKRLHIVDLDGARLAKTTNYLKITEIVKLMDTIPVQVGGGIRNMKQLDDYFSIGVSSCILGTVAVKDKNFFTLACEKYPNKIIAGLDAKGDSIAIDGWENDSQVNLFEFANWCAKVGASQILYTDIARDGMLSGLNLDKLIKLAKSSSIPIIASGGVADINDIQALLNTREKFFGVITGRALYQNTLNLKYANDLIEEFYK